MYFFSEQTAACCHPVFFFNLHMEHLMRNARMDELQAGIKNRWENINNQWYPSNDRKRKGTKEPLDEGEGGEEKSLKTKY